jgi:uncharacterized protein YqiB (DUF1249 family)
MDESIKTIKSYQINQINQRPKVINHYKYTYIIEIIGDIEPALNRVAAAEMDERLNT